ncbi:MAG: DUF6603 domain-containing protein [Pyrinomonadaceae bacterium]
MIKKNMLDPGVAEIGLLIGLLAPAGDDLAFNPGWFSHPISELEGSPGRVKELLDLINVFFTPVRETEYTLLSGDSQWYDIYAGWDNAPTGLCLVTPQTGSTSGVISLGLFSQLCIDELTISMYGRLPLFYLNEGQNPEFILASSLTQFKNLEIAIDVYSSTPIQVGTDSDFNLMSAAATVSFSDNFDTTFDLSFYQNFDPKTGNKTQLPIPSVEDVIVGRLGALVSQANYWLNGYIGDTPVTVGDLLSAAGLVTQTVDPDSGTITYSFDQKTFASLSKDPTAVLKRFLTNLVTELLEAMVTADEPLMRLYNGGIYAAKDAATNTYGVRLTVPDFVITGAGSTGPKVSIQLGKWFTNESSDQNWIQRITGAPVDPGIEILFLKFDGTTLSTASHFGLDSIGLDISGAGDAPLINLGGYTLKGAELRTSLDSDSWNYGFAIRMDEVGFPLAPSLADTRSGSAGTNVIAQNILASGSPPDGGAAGSEGDTSAVNPGFSAEAAYVSGHDPLLEIFDPQGNKTDTIWFPIQRRFGPFHCQKVGLKLDVTGDNQDDPVLGIIFDGEVALGQLEVDLDQLSLNAHLKNMGSVSDYQLDLQGLDVTFSNGAVEVSAGLLKSTDANNFISYDGEALIKTANLTVAALGSYCSLPNNGGTSMFIFGALNAPIGGPAFFYVTGLMAGFGYNRSLRIPDQDEVNSFPLLAGLVDPAEIGGPNPSPAEALSQLSAWVPPERGEYWLAAGVQFTTFEIIKTNALLIVEFGNDLSIAVLGISTLKQPQSGHTYVYAELGIEVVLLPRQGEFKASAVLASSSYVITPDAHLTGGFAFYAWFGDNEHAGDFVFTLGGYHPAFQPPAYYPQEPRVGINWQISDNLSMVGDAYFALTPSAMMAGGGLQVTFADGDLKAWLKAQADVLIFWKPFYLIADISISVGISYRLNLLFVHVTLSVEIGADFHLWGPPVGGTVHIDWYIISFTIGFGSDKNPPTEIGWDDFKQMLPTKPQSQVAATHRAGPRPMLRASGLSAAPATTDTPAYIHINVSDGLIRSHQADGMTFWLVRAGQFKFATGSALPASVIVVENHDPQTNVTIQGNKVGIQRVNGGISPDNYQSQQTVTILKLSKTDAAHVQACMATAGNCATQPAGCGETPADISDWEIDAVTKGLPTAMWGTPSSSTDPSINADSSTVTGTTGVTMYPKAPVITNCTPQMVIDDLFADRTVNSNQYMLPLSQTAPPSNNPPQAVDSFADISHINDSAVMQRRSAIFAALQSLGINAWTNDPLVAMAATPGKSFADEPMEGSTVINQAQ